MDVAGEPEIVPVSLYPLKLIGFFNIMYLIFLVVFNWFVVIFFVHPWFYLQACAEKGSLREDSVIFLFLYH